MGQAYVRWKEGLHGLITPRGVSGSVLGHVLVPAGIVEVMDESYRIPPDEQAEKFARASSVRSVLRRPNHAKLINEDKQACALIPVSLHIGRASSLQVATRGRAPLTKSGVMWHVWNARFHCCRDGPLRASLLTALGMNCILGKRASGVLTDRRC